MITSRSFRSLWLVPALVAIADAALAHEHAGRLEGFLSGFLHPILGWDHVAAMLAVGLLGTVLGPPAIWALPVSFILAMGLGGTVAAAGLTLPGVETGIAASALVLGLMVALAVRAPAWIAALAVAGFALFHGQAHGIEMLTAADPLAYGAGLMLASLFLLLSGTGIGLAAGGPAGSVVARTCGGLIALAGLGFLTTTI